MSRRETNSCGGAIYSLLILENIEDRAALKANNLPGIAPPQNKRGNQLCERVSLKPCGNLPVIRNDRAVNHVDLSV